MTWQRIQNIKDHNRLHVRLQVHLEAQAEVTLNLEVPDSPEDFGHLMLQTDKITFLLISNSTLKSVCIKSICTKTHSKPPKKSLKLEKYRFY